MKRTVTLALLLTAAVCWAQVAVNYMPDENAVRTFGGEPGPWNGHDFVMTIALDNGVKAAVDPIATFVADSLGGTIDINISKVYADSASIGAGIGVFLTATELLAYHNAGHSVGPQGIFKPRLAGAGEAWNKGFCSHATEDSIALDCDRAWFTTHTGIAEAGLRAATYPYGYHNGDVYLKLQDEGYLWGRNSKDGDWGFIETGWPTGFPDAPQIVGADIGTDIVNVYALAGEDSASYIVGQGESLTWSEVIARFEEKVVQPAIADGSYHLSLVIHDETYLTQYKWILNYLNDNYDVWFADFTTKMEWWQSRNKLYPRRPPADAKGSILAGVTAADSIWWAKTAEPEAVHGFVFSNSSTATLDTTDVGGHTFPAINDQELAVRSSAPTTTYTGGYFTYHLGAMPMNGSDRLGALYFDVSSTLAGKTISSATLHWRTDWTPAEVTYGPPETTGYWYHAIISVTDANFAAWVGYGSGASSYDNVDQATSTAWGTPLANYATRESLGPVSYQWGTWEPNIWTSTDVTHGVQAWADGEPEGGFLFFGEYPSTKLFSVQTHTNGTASYRPYLVVYTED